MRLQESLKIRAKGLKKEIIAIYYAHQDARTGFLPKALMLITLGYALSPIDLIPDFIPVLGYLDDLIIVPGLIALSIRLIPADVMAAARERAEREPIHLASNRLFAFLFILVWLVVLFLVIRFLLRVAGAPLNSNL